MMNQAFKACAQKCREGVGGCCKAIMSYLSSLQCSEWRSVGEKLWSGKLAPPGYLKSQFFAYRQILSKLVTYRRLSLIPFSPCKTEVRCCPPWKAKHMFAWSWWLFTPGLETVFWVLCCRSYIVLSRYGLLSWLLREDKCSDLSAVDRI